METVFIAMSGGLDSSFSAYLLKKRGYRVVGFTFDLLPRALRNDRNQKMCCSAVNVHRAKRVADHLSIPHYVINAREDFERHVIQRFIDEYRAGRTPNPCVLCNRYIKFSAFLKKSIAMGADRVATGHYACIEETAAGFRLKKGKDRTKDQSYFLYPISRNDLSLITFPLAGYTKAAARAEFPLRERSDPVESQDICFIQDNDYRGFISRFISLKKGPVVTAAGVQVGWHNGVHLYTIGQRRGLGIPFTEPLYVVELRTEENVVVVGAREELKQERLIADELNLFTDALEGEARARVRYRQGEAACRYTVKDAVMEVTFNEPVSSVTPGQSVVLYDGETVLGGGTILKNGENRKS
jgi:tRNA-uridine 2-sulfurtransferase